MGAGISLDSATTNVTRMLGPFLGGVTYGFLGLEGAFIISAYLTPYVSVSPVLSCLNFNR